MSRYRQNEMSSKQMLTLAELVFGFEEETAGPDTAWAYDMKLARQAARDLLSNLEKEMSHKILYDKQSNNVAGLLSSLDDTETAMERRIEQLEAVEDLLEKIGELQRNFSARMDTIEAKLGQNKGKGISQSVALAEFQAGFNQALAEIRALIERHQGAFAPANAAKGFDLMKHLKQVEKKARNQTKDQPPEPTGPIFADSRNGLANLLHGKSAFGFTLAKAKAETKNKNYNGGK